MSRACSSPLISRSTISSPLKSNLRNLRKTDLKSTIPCPKGACLPL